MKKLYFIAILILIGNSINAQTNKGKSSKGFNVITNNETFFMEIIQRRKLVINDIYKIHEDEILQYLNENFTNNEL